MSDIDEDIERVRQELQHLRQVGQDKRLHQQEEIEKWTAAREVCREQWQRKRTRTPLHLYAAAVSDCSQMVPSKVVSQQARLCQCLHLMEVLMKQQSLIQKQHRDHVNRVNHAAAQLEDERVEVEMKYMNQLVAMEESIHNLENKLGRVSSSPVYARKTIKPAAARQWWPVVPASNSSNGSSDASSMKDKKQEEAKEKPAEQEQRHWWPLKIDSFKVVAEKKESSHQHSSWWQSSPKSQDDQKESPPPPPPPKKESWWGTWDHKKEEDEKKLEEKKESWWSALKGAPSSDDEDSERSLAVEEPTTGAGKIWPAEQIPDDYEQPILKKNYSGFSSGSGGYADYMFTDSEDEDDSFEDDSEDETNVVARQWWPVSLTKAEDQNDNDMPDREVHEQLNKCWWAR